MSDRPIAPEPIALREGAVIGEKYELRRCLDAGGMGTIWEAYQPALDQAVALKFLATRRAGSPEARSRFELEAKLAAKLGQASRHIVRVLDSGVVTEPDGATLPYLVMELLQGRTLAAILQQSGRLPFDRAVEVTRQLCRALEITHREGIVHRDLKPSNLFLARDEERDADEARVVLIDFGIAKTLAPQDHATATGAVLGSAGYMSPEQISGTGRIGPATDLWAVVAVTYRMVVGEPPFGTGSLEEIATRVVASPAPRPSEQRAELPAAFDRWVARGLAKHPDDRFGSAPELAAALAEIPVPSQDEVVAPDAAPPSLIGDADATTAQTGRPPVSLGGRRVILAVAAAMLAVVGIGIWTVWGVPKRQLAVDAHPPPSAAPPEIPAPSASAAEATAPPVHSAAPPMPETKPRTVAPSRPSKRRARDTWLDTSEF